MDKAANRRAAKALVGTTIKRRYQVVRLLGDGGMGAVYKAADTVLRRFVAIKMLHPSTSDSPSAVERFVREARSSAAIGHPNIIDVLDFGYDGRRPYLVMEYLRGRSLSEAIAEEGRLSVARACNIATHSLAGLSAAHDRGILHRDLKPANMMLIALLGDRDFVKLCDFGFAALVQPSVRIDGGKTLTPARTLVGTPAYAAPERLKGDDRRDPRLDVWSTGVVLFETLAGRRPFDAPTFRELARKIRKDPTPSLRSMRSDIPRGLDAVVQKALSKKRSGRFSTAAEFAAALVPFGGRVVPDFADAASDSFTMDLLRLRARETQQRHAVELDTDEQAEEARDIEALRQRFRAERKRREPADETSVERPSAARPYLGSAERQPQRPAPPALGQREPRRSRRRMA
ncbi:MAG: serine/threonine-protein kinase, partial [Myxococcota bacterium]